MASMPEKVVLVMRAVRVMALTALHREPVVLLEAHAAVAFARDTDLTEEHAGKAPRGRKVCECASVVVVPVGIPTVGNKPHIDE